MLFFYAKFIFLDLIWFLSLKKNYIWIIAAAVRHCYVGMTPIVWQHCHRVDKSRHYTPCFLLLTWMLIQYTRSYMHMLQLSQLNQLLTRALKPKAGRSEVFQLWLLVLTSETGPWNSAGATKVSVFIKNVSQIVFFSKMLKFTNKSTQVLVCWRF